MTRNVIAIVGPTASGKTDISVSLAEMINGEIISADSRLVYKDFNIGTAKPDSEEKRRIPHYMIDIESPKNKYTVEKYKKEAAFKIEEILNRKKIPLIVGGTGLYIKALLEGLDIPEISPNEDFRKEMQKIAEIKGNEALYNTLKHFDPVTAKKLHPNDSFRIIRALEVKHVTGKPMSELQTVSKPDYNVLYVGLNAYEREFLYDRINHRALKMIEKGLVEEVKSLIIKYGRTVSLMKTLGYREICESFDGSYSLDEAVEKIQKNTRNFAKRQLTWFRANKEINWFYIDHNNPEKICFSIVEKLEKFY